MGALGCERSEPEGELTQAECTKIVQKINRLQSKDSARLAARDRSEEASRRQCLKHGTQRAYRCYMAAAKASDLAACKMLLTQ